jgi:hypothetical protein
LLPRGPRAAAPVITHFMPNPTPASVPASSSETVHALVGEFFEHKQREAQELALAEAPRRGRKLLASVAFVVCAAAWILPSLYPPPQPPVSPQRLDASARMTLFLASERVRAFERVHQRLPRTLVEAGVDTTGISFWRSTSSGFEIGTTVNGARLLYDSNTPNVAFLGSTLQVLSTAR